MDDRVPERRDSQASSHEQSLEPTLTRSVDLGKHRVYTHFPKDRNCEICLKAKITRASCRRRAGTVVPRAENFGDLITADHKILSEGSELRNNHRYWQLSGYNPTCVKQKLLRKRTRTYKGPVRKTQWRSRTSSRKFW